MEELVLWLVKYWLEILFSGLVGGVGIAAKYAWGQIKQNYINVVQQNQDDIKKLKESIDNKFDSIDSKINALAETSRKNDVSLIRDAVLRKIRHGLQDPSGCISMADAETTAALMAQYEELGGNGEVHKLYKRYEKLGICPEFEHHYCEDDLCGGANKDT